MKIEIELSQDKIDDIIKSVQRTISLQVEALVMSHLKAKVQTEIHKAMEPLRRDATAAMQGFADQEIVAAKEFIREARLTAARRILKAEAAK